MKKCKCIKATTYFSGIDRNNLYYYNICDKLVNSHRVFSMKTGNELLDIFTEIQFKEMFTDIQAERKEKIKKLNESR